MAEAAAKFPRAALYCLKKVTASNCFVWKKENLEKNAMIFNQTITRVDRSAHQK